MFQSVQFSQVASARKTIHLQCPRLWSKSPRAHPWLSQTCHASFLHSMFGDEENQTLYIRKHEEKKEEAHFSLETQVGCLADFMQALRSSSKMVSRLFSIDLTKLQLGNHQTCQMKASNKPKSHTHTHTRHKRKELALSLLSSPTILPLDTLSILRMTAVSIRLHLQIIFVQAKWKEKNRVSSAGIGFWNSIIAGSTCLLLCRSSETSGTKRSKESSISRLSMARSSVQEEMGWFCTFFLQMMFILIDLHRFQKMPKGIIKISNCSWG